jgi:hypothetical protein
MIDRIDLKIEQIMRVQTASKPSNKAGQQFNLSNSIQRLNQTQSTSIAKFY